MRVRRTLSSRWWTYGLALLLVVVGWRMARMALGPVPMSGASRTTLLGGGLGCVLAALAICWLVRARSRDAAALARQAQELAAARAGAMAARGEAHALLVRMGLELRTPVEVMIGTGEQLAERSATPTGSVRQLDGMLRAAKRLRQLVAVVLDLARLESGRIEIAPQPVPLPALLRRLDERLMPAASTAGVTLVLPAAEATHPSLTADVERYEQILLLLVDQALTMTPAGGRVSVRFDEETRAGVEGVRAIIKDTGVGMGPDELPPHVLGSAVEGLGDAMRRSSAPALAVSLARRLALLLGGEITASSPGPGLGATVVVWMPARPAPGHGGGLQPGTPEHLPRDHHAVPGALPARDRGGPGESGRAFRGTTASPRETAPTGGSDSLGSL